MKIYSKQLLLQSGNSYVWTIPEKKEELASETWRILYYNPSVANIHEGKFTALSASKMMSFTKNGASWEEPRQTGLGNTTWIDIEVGGISSAALYQVAISSTGYVATNLASSSYAGWGSGSYVSNLGSRKWAGIAYGNGKFVVLGEEGYVSNSSDNGSSWTSASYKSALGSSNGYTAIEFGNDIFVALGYYGHISTSSDGVSWTTAVKNTNLGENRWGRIAYGNGLFMAISMGGYVSTSTDGTNWTEAQLNPNMSPGISSWTGLAYGENKFIAITYDGQVATTI